MKRIVRDRESGQSKCYGTVRFASDNDALYAMNAMNDQE